MGEETKTRLKRGADRYGCRHKREAGRLTCGDLRMIMRLRHLTAAEVANVIRRPKATVMRWVKNEGPTDPGFGIPLRAEDALKLLAC